MGRVIYFFGEASDLADSNYSTADKAAMTTTPADAYVACPAGTVTLESVSDSKKGENKRMLVNSVNDSDVGATPFDFLGQIIEISSNRTNYIKGSLGDIIVCDDGL